MNWFIRKPKIGLALGSGGPKGLAHIGVLKVLERHKIPINYIAGSSAGAIAGAFYAAKKNIYDMEQYILKKGALQILKIFLDPSFKHGLISGNNFKKFLADYLNNLTFNDLLIPFKAVCVELKTGQLIQIGEKDVVTAVLASCGMPFFFSPVQVEDEYYIDGAVLMPIPVSVVQQMGADIIIAVNLNSQDSLNQSVKKPNIYSVSQRSINIMINNNAKNNLKDADIVISPFVHNVYWRSLFRDKDKRIAIKAGELAMEKGLPELKKIIAQKSSLWHLFSSKLNKKLY